MDFDFPQVDNCLMFPHGNEIGKDRTPSHRYPSDHFSLLCDFELKDDEYDEDQVNNGHWTLPAIIRLNGDENIDFYKFQNSNLIGIGIYIYRRLGTNHFPILIKNQKNQTKNIIIWNSIFQLYGRRWITMTLCVCVSEWVCNIYVI